MADAGVPVHVLRKIARHGSRVTTQRYLHPDAQSIADAGAALQRSPDSKLVPRWSPAKSGARKRTVTRQDAINPLTSAFTVVSGLE